MNINITVRHAVLSLTRFVTSNVPAGSVALWLSKEQLEARRLQEADQIEDERKQEEERRAHAIERALKEAEQAEERAKLATARIRSMLRALGYDAEARSGVARLMATAFVADDHDYGLPLDQVKQKAEGKIRAILWAQGCDDEAHRVEVARRFVTAIVLGDRYDLYRPPWEWAPLPDSLISDTDTLSI